MRQTNGSVSPELGGFNNHAHCCAVLGFEESGCKVYLPPRGLKWLCLSGDKYTANHKHGEKLADLLFAWQVDGDSRRSCVLELKSGKIRVSGVVEQLQEGARIVDGLLADVAVSFLPVLVHGPIPTVTHRALQKERIGFRGSREHIRLLNCGGKVETLRW